MADRKRHSHSSLLRLIVCGPAMLFLLLPSGVALAQSPTHDLQKQLEDRYVGKVVVLRGYPRAVKLQYDRAGHLLSNGDNGLGPSDGLFHITAAKVEKSRVTLDGDVPMQVYYVDRGVTEMVPGRLRRQVHLRLDSPTMDEVQRALDEIFVRAGEPYANVEPCSAVEREQFRQVVAKHLAMTGPLPSGIKAENANLSAGICFPDGVRVPPVGKGVNPPRAVYSGEPGDVPATRDFEGTLLIYLVIDKTGRPSMPVVIRPIGKGIDERGVQSVHGWRFKPATRNGEPLPVAILIEMNMHINKK